MKMHSPFLVGGHMSKVELDITKLVGRSLLISKACRQGVLNAMDDHMDKIRDVADKVYLIPDKYPGKSLKYKLKYQKSDPHRLTSRTGAYKKMLYMGKGQWKKGSSTHVSDGPAVQGRNKTINKNTTVESYEGTLSYNIKNASAISSKRTAQQLKMRFLHDTGSGLKGKKRAGIPTAGKALGMQDLEVAAKKRLSALGVT